jgi:uncharacterized protein YigE (DUF2233 family)
LGIRKILLLLLLLLVVLGAWFWVNEKGQKREVISPAPKNEVDEVPLETKTYINNNGKDYEVFVQEIKGDVELIPNFSEKIPSEEILRTRDCKFGSNGGFYLKEGGPLGLFSTKGKIIGKQIQSTTFNGFFWKRDGKLFLDWQGQKDWEGTDFALQAGPLFDVEYLGKISFVDEEERRRVLVANDKGGKFYLLVIFEKDNKYSGPKLADITEVLRKNGAIHFDRALNLDGGSASCFYGENGQKLWEIVNVGSFLCGK